MSVKHGIIQSDIQVTVDGRSYHVENYQSVQLSDEAPRLVVVSYLPNRVSQSILRVCLQSIQKYTKTPYELWVVDNNSPRENLDWLLAWPDINVVLNRTRPSYPKYRDLIKYIKGLVYGQIRHPYEASYANGVALELAAQLIPPQSKYMLTMHMDTMPCFTGWLAYLKSKIDQGCAAAGVRLDRVRTPDGILHILGNLLDFQLFRELGLNFLPKLPRYDTGDLVTIGFRKAGYQLYACENSLWAPDLIDLLPIDSPFRNFHVDRAFNEYNQVIFLHLSRGIQKSAGAYQTGATSEEWIDFAKNHILV